MGKRIGKAVSAVVLAATTLAAAPATAGTGNAFKNGESLTFDADSLLPDGNYNAKDIWEEQNGKRGSKALTRKQIREANEALAASGSKVRMDENSTYVVSNGLVYMDTSAPKKRKLSGVVKMTVERDGKKKVVKKAKKKAPAVARKTDVTVAKKASTGARKAKKANGTATKKASTGATNAKKANVAVKKNAPANAANARKKTAFRSKKTRNSTRGTGTSFFGGVAKAVKSAASAIAKAVGNLFRDRQEERPLPWGSMVRG